MLTMFRLAPTDSHAQSDGASFQLPSSITSICRLATGRSSLFHLISRLPHPHAATVLLPTYVAEGVIQPFLVAGFNILFYRLESDLSPVVDDLVSQLAKTEGRAVVILIHYFGFPSYSSDLLPLLSPYQPIIVDDCAHAAFSTTPDAKSLAENADLALYSFNKFLPVVDGAIIISNRSDINLSLDEQTLVELPDVAQKAYKSHLQAARDLFASNDPCEARQFLKKIGEYYQQYYEVINTDLKPFCQSSYSKRIVDSFPFDWLIQKRLINSHIVYSELQSPLFSLVHKRLPSGIVPWCIPARVPSLRRREILDRLFDQGVLLSTLQDKWDFIPVERRGRYPIETAFLDEHVLIPISEFISETEMYEMVERLNHI